MVKVPIFCTSSGNEMLSTNLLVVSLSKHLLNPRSELILQGQVESDGGRQLDLTNYPYIFMVKNALSFISILIIQLSEVYIW